MTVTEREEEYARRAGKGARQLQSTSVARGSAPAASHRTLIRRSKGSRGLRGSRKTYKEGEEDGCQVVSIGPGPCTVGSHTALRADVLVSRSAPYTSAARTV